MNARDVMTSRVVSVRADTPTDRVARLLLQNGISAMPVLDAGGAPIGMISEGDLIGRNETDRESRPDWWLTLLAEGEALNDDFLASLRAPSRTAGEVMSAPVISVTETTDVTDIAKLLASQRVKRVPVVRDGRVVGIVSRADLLRALADEPHAEKHPDRDKSLSSRVAGLFSFGGPRLAVAAPESRKEKKSPQVIADVFRALEDNYKRGEATRKDAACHAAAEQREQRVKRLIEHHVDEAGWAALLQQARQAAERGEREFLLLRFPSDLCSDGGRAINNSEADWPKTLRGEAAEIYREWERELRPHGFGLGARVLEFPGGFPGDVGLFLIWG